MAEIVDYDYIEEISTLDALRNLASDTTNGYSQELPGVNTFLINAAAQAYNFPEGGGGTGIAGWSTDVNRSSSDYNTLSWGSGSIYMPDGTTLSVSSGNTGNMSSTTYIYYDMETQSVSYTTTASSAVGENKILLCVAAPTSSGKECAFQAFGTNKQSMLITADNIAANTITANEIASNTITANEIQSGAITTSKLDVGAVTAGKIDVSQLSDIDPDLGSITAGNIKGVTITAGTTTGTGTGVKIYPSSSTSGRIDFYYNGNVVGYASGLYNSTVGGGVTVINGSNAVVIDGYLYNFTKVDFSQSKLRIPVGTNLY